MASTATTSWITNRTRFLNAFTLGVENKEYERLPYPNWRALNNSPYSYIKIVKDYDEKEYRIYNYDINKAVSTNTLFRERFNRSSTDFEKGNFADFLEESWGRWIPSFSTNNYYYFSLDEEEEEDIYEFDEDEKIEYSWDPIDSAISNPNYNNTITIKEEEENNNMKTNNLFNFEFGPVSSNQFRMSPYGIAVKTLTNGWVSYNNKTGEIFDVDILNFDISKLIFKMPVALTSVAVGDILIHGNKPVFVRAINANGTVSVVNYADATVVDILPVKSPFGFNFFTKVCALIDFNGASANEKNPFGNMLPFLMIAGENDGDFDPTMLFLANSITGNGNDNANVFQNPMMLYFLMSRRDKADILPFLMMANSDNLFNAQNNIFNTTTTTTTNNQEAYTVKPENEDK